MTHLTYLCANSTSHIRTIGKMKGRLVIYSKKALLSSYATYLLMVVCASLWLGIDGPGVMEQYLGGRGLLISRPNHPHQDK